MSFTRARASRVASSCPKDFNFQFFVFQEEGRYMSFYGARNMLDGLYELAESGWWNAVLIVLEIIVITRHTGDIRIFSTKQWKLFVDDYSYNILFGINLIALAYRDYRKIKLQEIKFSYFRNLLWYVMMLATYAHFFRYAYKNRVDTETLRFVKFAVYLIRSMRSLHYVFTVIEHHLNGRIYVVFAKYWYISHLTRVVWSYVCVLSGYHEVYTGFLHTPQWMLNPPTLNFLRIYYQVQKIYVQIGMDYDSVVIQWQILCLFVTFSGCVIFVGMAIPSMSHVMCTVIRPKELFRLKCELIWLNFERARIPKLIQDKVMQFYTMFWVKQKGVSRSKIVDDLPISLRASIYTDIYFEAHQKSRVLRDLSYQFLQELSRVMKTTNYVPGDIIVKRNDPKSTMYFVTYGDVEVLTAEDDMTPILRFTRGTIINPCGVAVEVGVSLSHVAVRAATFCTMHVLRCADLWRVCAKFGHINGQSFILHCSFEEHFYSVKKHYEGRHKKAVQYKSSILQLKRNLLELKAARDADGRPLMAREDKFIDIAGCYIMRNKEDITTLEDADDICLRTSFPCILQPSSSLLHAWKGLISVLTLIFTFWYPYQVAYVHTISPYFIFFNWTMSIIYTIDLLAILSTGTNIEEGVPVTFTETSAEQMKNPWIVLDVIAIIPLKLFFYTERFEGLPKLLKLFKVFFFLHDMEDVYMSARNYLRLASYILSLVCFTYLMASLKQGTFCFLQGRCRVTNLTNNVFWARLPLDDNSPYRRVLMSIFWALALVTFTDLKTNNFTWFSYTTQVPESLMMEISIIFRMVINSIFAGYIMVNDSLTDDFESCKKKVTKFLEKSRVDKVLKTRYIEYLNLRWEVDKAFSITQKKSVLSDLPDHVNSEVMEIQRNRYLHSFQFWNFLNDVEMNMLAENTKEILCAPHEILMNTGDTVMEMYVIKDGVCEVYDPESKEVITHISKKRSFGELEVLLQTPAYYSIRAITHVLLYSLSYKHILTSKVLRKPQFANAVHFCTHRPEFQSLMVRRRLFLKYEPVPPAPSRKVFPLLRKFEADTAYQEPFQHLGFFSALRYVLPRFTIRPDGPYIWYYEWFRTFCACCMTIIAPCYSYHVTYYPNLFYIFKLLELAGYYDIFQRMLVGYFNEKGILVAHPANTAAHYLKTSFLYDFLSVVPLEHVDSIRKRIYVLQNHYREPTLYQLLHVNRTLQLYRAVCTLSTLKEHISRRDIMLVIKSLPVFVAFVSIATVYSLGFLAKLFSRTTTDNRVSYIIIHENSSLDPWMKNYIVKYDVMGSPGNCLITVYYWILSEVTTTGFRFFSANTEELIIVLSFARLTITVLLTYVAMKIISIRGNLDKSLARFQQHIKDLLVYMKKENFSNELQTEALSYFKNRWEHTGGSASRELLKLCDQITLRTEVILHIYGPTFLKNPLLRYCEQNVLRSMGRGVSSTFFQAGITIIEQDDVNDSIYFLAHGTVAVFDMGAKQPLLITKLPRGSVFGNLEYMNQSKCFTRFVADSNVHLLKIATDLFHKIIAPFPKIGMVLVKHRPNNENYILGVIPGASNKVMTTWKERALSSALTAMSRQLKILTYFNLNSKPVQMYIVIISLLSLYCNIYNASFRHDDYTFICCLYILDILFLLKLIINYLITTYLSDEERNVLGGTKSSRKCSKELLADILSCLPIEIFALFGQQDIWHANGMLRLNRLFRVISMQIYLNGYRRQLSTSLTFTTIFNVLIWFTLFIHVTACLWHKLALYEENFKYKNSWLYTVGDEVHLCQDTEYFCSIFFILITFVTTGTNDLTARTQLEVIFVCILMTVSPMIFVIYLGEFSNVLQFQNFRVLEYVSRRLECYTFLRNNRVSESLIQQVSKYTLFMWRQQKGRQVPYFLNQAPQALRTKIMSTAYMYHLTSHDIFKNCDPALLRQITACFRVRSYLGGMTVVKEGEVRNAMYFVHKGVVIEMSEDFEEELRDYEDGHNFGTINGLFPNTPYLYTYKIKTKTILLSLHLKDWKYLLDHFPDDKHTIYKSQDFSKGLDRGTKHKKKENVLTKATKAIFKEKKLQIRSSEFKTDGRPSSTSNMKKHWFSMIGKKDKLDTPEPALEKKCLSQIQFDRQLFYKVPSEDKSSPVASDTGLIVDKETDVVGEETPKTDTENVKLGETEGTTSKLQLSPKVNEQRLDEVVSIKESKIKDTFVESIPVQVKASVSGYSKKETLKDAKQVGDMSTEGKKLRENVVPLEQQPKASSRPKPLLSTDQSTIRPEDIRKQQSIEADLLELDEISIDEEKESVDEEENFTKKKPRAKVKRFIKLARNKVTVTKDEHLDDEEAPTPTVTKEPKEEDLPLSDDDLNVEEELAVEEEQVIEEELPGDDLETKESVLTATETKKEKQSDIDEIEVRSIDYSEQPTGHDVVSETKDAETTSPSVQADIDISDGSLGRIRSQMSYFISMPSESNKDYDAIQEGPDLDVLLEPVPSVESVFTDLPTATTTAPKTKLSQDKKSLIDYEDEVILKSGIMKPPSDATMKKTSLSDINIEVMNVPTRSRSALSFKEEVEMVEIPKVRSADLAETNIISLDEAVLESMLSYTGDIVLKEGGKGDKEGLMARDVEKGVLDPSRSKTYRESMQSITSLHVPSVWSVEGFTQKQYGGNIDTNIPLKLPSKQSITSELSVSKSLESLGDASDTAIATQERKKSKKGLVWKEEEEEATTSSAAPAWLQGVVNLDMIDSKTLEKLSTSPKSKPKDPKHPK